MLSINFFKLYKVFEKSQNIKRNKVLDFVKQKIESELKNKTSEILINLENPYGFTGNKFFIIKYILSFLICILIFFRTNNFFISIIIYTYIFFIPNIIIFFFKKNENNKIIEDLNNIANSLILSTSADINLVDALKYSVNIIKYPRFKRTFNNFVNDYVLFNYNINKAIIDIRNKFDYYELNLFTDILIQENKNGKIDSALKVFSETLDLSYFKYLKYKSLKRNLLITFATVISVINITAISVYPIIMQIIDSLNQIFI